MKKSLFVVAVMTVLSGCQSGNIEKSITVDSLYINGDIITMEDSQREVEAIAIKDGLIYAVGDEKTLLQYQGDNTKVVDLKGKTLMPGFIDPHSHFSNVVFIPRLLFLSPNLLTKNSWG